MKTKQIIFGSMLGLILLPSLRASEFDKKTIITLPEPMAIPGMVLPEGEYVVKRADHSLPNVIRFSSADETKVFATVHTIPTEREKATDKVEIVTEERPAGAPEAIKKWFYPGEITGAEFVYPKSDLMAQATPPGSLEARSPSPAPAAASRDEAEDSEATVREPLAKEPVSESAEPVEIAQTQPPAAPRPGATQTRPAREAETLPAQQELPRTATGLTLTSLLGGLAVFGGAALRRLSRRLS